ILVSAAGLAPLAQTKQTLLMNRLGPSQMTLYIANGDGSGERPLLASSSFDYNASFSLDGHWIVFPSARAGSGQAAIYRISPDGRWIAFTSDRHYPFRPHREPVPGWEHPQELSIYIIQADGQGLRRLTMAGVTTGSPKWSPDGRRIVFYELPTEWTFAARIQAQGQVTSQIVSFDVASGARKVHTSGPGLKVSPQYMTADRIAYVVKASPQPAETGLAFTTGDRGAGGSFRNPSWSADGKLVVYQKADFTARPQNQPLYSWDPGMDVRYTEVFPHFSKDGR